MERFSNFGRLFEEAIDQGLPAIQTQHPGFVSEQEIAVYHQSKVHIS